MARAFTPPFVQNVKPGDRRREIPDPGCRGLHLIVQSTGVKVGPSDTGSAARR